MVLIIHDFNDRTLRFEKSDKIILRGKFIEFTDDIAINKILPYCKLNVNNIWFVRLWRLYNLYNMFIDKNEGDITFDNNIITDEKNKIKYILVLDMSSIDLSHRGTNLEKI